MTELTAEPTLLPPSPPPSRPDFYLVLACTAGAETWTVPSSLRAGGGLFTSREAAEKAASDLPRVWWHKCLVRIPGSE